ncbi:Ribosomal large subunit pseudouridine synthase B [Clostridium liquoris]|uniref:Pseudouridine synthase n=1 Tax=Clostridium liquoris TaxID=1289519 RepID=A0A2T0B5B1_9CLOT|nr:pseudouridine synthase [Clostridium liquoris]PRR79065.1 Ribosomal large subunit pseudouridine synthase B [Clostridium liquoris]
MERLDKVLANLGYGTRKEVKALVKSGAVEVNGALVKDSGMNIDPEKNQIKVHGEEIKYRKYIYLIMNKPEGVVSATFDNYDETVIDLLDPEYQVFNPFPVGRLDKDTVGLLLITNDGELNHKLISPKWHVDKIYYAEIDKVVNERDIKAFESGIVLDDDYKCMPGKLQIIEADGNGSKVYVTIQEGKFHQVKRMFEALDKKVVYLKRVKFGDIDLDEALEEGEYRELTEEELNKLKDAQCNNWKDNMNKV